MLRTQVTQNHTPSSEPLYCALVEQYGGHFTVNISLSRKPFFNWQLNTTTALEFLEKIEPYLVLKKEQAQLAIAWQRQKPKPSRNAKGQYVRYERDAYDEKVASLLKQLKSQSWEQAMAAQADLVDIVHTLNQCLCVKG
jgi:hypothetical protein